MMMTSLEQQTSIADGTVVSALTFDSYPEMTPAFKMSRGISLGSWNSVANKTISLYGRTGEVMQLRTAYARIGMANAPSETVVLRGPAGTGKSTLMESLRDLVTSQNGYFVTGKYDQYRMEPYSAIVAGLTDTIDLISQSRDVAVRCAVLQQDLHDELPVLSKLISGLSYFMDPIRRQQFEANSGTNGDLFGNTGQALREFKRCCRKLLRALSSTSHPLVFFLDDVQWSQRACRDLIESFLTDEESKNILFVCAYDDNKDGATSELDRLFERVSETCRQNARAGPIHRVMQLELTNLGLNEVNRLLADVLEVDASSTWPLSEVVLAKTHGNPYFVWQFIDVLHQDGLISLPSRASESSELSTGSNSHTGTISNSNHNNNTTNAHNINAFTTNNNHPNNNNLNHNNSSNNHSSGASVISTASSWNIDRIRSQTNISENVLPIISSRIQKLRISTRAVLSVAAVIGYEFHSALLDATIEQAVTFGTDYLSRNDSAFAVLNQEGGISIFLELLDSSCSNFEAIIASAMKDGLLERISDDKGSNRYKFSHHKIHECLYNRITDERERDTLHLLIGRQMQLVCEEGALLSVEKEKLWFDTVNHLNRGATQIDEVNEFVRLSKTNLYVAKLAIKKAAFVSAEKYLTDAYTHLRTQKDMWKDHYELSVEICTGLAKMKHATGEYTGCNQLIVTVLDKTKCFEDRFEVSDLTISVLFAQGKVGDALCNAVALLNLVDRKVPQKPSKLGLMTQVLKTQRLLRGKKLEEICRLPLMKDKKKIMIAKIYADICKITFFSRSTELGAYACLRLVQMTLKHGLCEYSPSGFGMYGILALKHNDDASSAYEYGKLSVRLCEALEQREAAGVTTICATVPAHVMLLHWKDRLEGSVGPLGKAADAALHNGDTEYGLLAGFNHALAGFLCDTSLQTVEEQLKKLCQRSEDLKQEHGLLCALPLWQAIQNMIGSSENTVSLDGDAMTEADLLARATKTGNTAALLIWRYSKFFLAVFFGATFQAHDLMNEIENDTETLFPSGHFHALTYKLLVAVTICTFLRRNESQNGRKKDRRRVKKIAADLRKSFSQGCVNAGPYLLFVEAESQAVDGRRAHEVVAAYEKTIKKAKDLKFVHMECLANERIGLWLLEQSRTGEQDPKYRRTAQQHIETAIDLYEEWGAYGLIDCLEDRVYAILSTLPWWRRSRAGGGSGNGMDDNANCDGNGHDDDDEESGGIPIMIQSKKRNKRRVSFKVGSG